jgi:hypothetical protein
MDAAYPVRDTDTQEAAEEFAHAHTAHRDEYPCDTVMPSCCHMLPSLSVTLTAGQFGGGTGA